MNITIKIGKQSFRSPVTVASGTWAYEKKFQCLRSLKQLGAIVPKTVTLKAQEGNPPQRIVETPAGMVNAIGIENPGVDVFIKNKLPELKTLGVPVIVSVSAQSEEDFIALAKKLDKAGIAAIELNLSCPNLKHKILVAQDPFLTKKIIKSVKKATSLPVIAKLSPNVTDITVVAKAAEDAGADGLAMINTLSAMVIDVQTRKPILGNVTGGLSGPAIRPVAVNMVYRTAQVVKIPIIAMGGIMTANDALEFLIAGASMVAVGTANFIDLNTPQEVLAGIKEYMKKNKIENIKALIGSVQG